MIDSRIASFRKPSRARPSFRSIAMSFLFLLSLIASGHAAAQGLLAKVSGDKQHGAPGSRLPQAMVVVIHNGNPEPTYSVEWNVTSGDATFINSGTTRFTTTIPYNASSSTRLQLGFTPGPVTVSATLSTACSGGPSPCGPINTVTFAATVDQPPQLQKISGDAQSGAVGSTLAQPLVARVVTNSSTPTDVIWQVSGDAIFPASGTQTLEQPSVAPNVDDPVTLMLGTKAGPVQIHVSCASCANSIDFTATATGGTNPGQPAQIVKASGDNQTGATGSSGDAPLVVQVLDANSLPISGQTVTWQVLSGSATVDATSSASDSQGHAQTTFHFGTQGGASVIRATSGTVTVDFTVSAFVPNLSIVSGDGQSAAPGTQLPQPLTVRIGQATTGSHTQGLQNTTIVWTVIAGNGSVATATTQTDASGTSSNRFTLGPNPGGNQVQAGVEGGGSVIFNETGTITGAKLAIVSGDGQSLATYQPSQPLVVRLSDAQDRPVSGITIQWTPSANAVLTNATSVTDVDGRANTIATLHVTGSATVGAQAVGATATPVSFSLNGGLANIPGLTPSEHAVAVAIDKACAALSVPTLAPLPPGQADLLSRCTELTKNAGSNPQPVVHALDALTNDRATPQISTAQTLQLAQMDNLDQRLAALRHGAQGASMQGLSFVNDGKALPLDRLGDTFDKPANTDHEAGGDFSRWGFFVTGTYAHGSGDARAVRPGFDYDNAGLTAGVDYRFNDHFVAGVAVGYGHNSSDIDANLGSFDSDAYNLSAYATWYTTNDFYLNAAASLGWADYSLSRSIVYQITSDSGATNVNQVAKSSPNGDQRSLVLALGKDFHHDAWDINPEVRANYTRVSIDAYNESMRDPSAPGGGLGLHVADRAQTDLLGIVGVRASYTMSQDWGILIPNAQIEYNHEFNSSSNNVLSWFINDPTATPILLADPRANSNFFTFSFGMNAVWPNGKSGFILIEHVSAQQGVTENRLSVGGRIEF